MRDWLTIELVLGSSTQRTVQDRKLSRIEQGAAR
jgi:hypothetical protein